MAVIENDTRKEARAARNRRYGCTYGCGADSYRTGIDPCQGTHHTTHHKKFRGGRCRFNMMPSTPSNVNTNISITPQEYTYVVRMDPVIWSARTSDDIKTRLQSLLGSDHEVVSTNKLKFNTQDVIQNVVVVRTCAPALVATRLLGNSWVTDNYTIYKARPSSS